MVTIKYNNVYVNNWFTICGSDEANGNIKNVNMVLKDKYYGEKTLEDAEIKMPKKIVIFWSLSIMMEILLLNINSMI